MENEATRIALIQLAVGTDKQTNVSRAVQFVREAAEQGAKIVILPECFNSPYGANYFAEYAEPIPGYTTHLLAAAAKENNVFIIGGSIPESDGGRLYNACPVLSPDGELIAKHRKVHLFDAAIPGKPRFLESETLSAGNQLTVVQTPSCKIGIGICHDIRFPEVAQIYATEGCNLLVYPSAFEMTTGASLWELVQRARAVDNQLFVAAVSPARDETASYLAWGHSSAVNPWGEIIAKADENERIVCADIDFAMVAEVRRQIPLMKQRRGDLYTTQIINQSRVTLYN